MLFRGTIDASSESNMKHTNSNSLYEQNEEISSVKAGKLIWMCETEEYNS
jgi:hypothetical protein